MGGGVDRGRDWSELNPELLESIAGAFTELSDHFLFRSVCKSWRSACTAPLTRGNPWLLILPSEDSPAQEEEDCKVISPFDDWRCFTLRTPYSVEMQASSIFGSPYGYFLVINEATGSIAIADPLISGSWTTLPISVPKTGPDEETFLCRAKIVESIGTKLSIIVTISEDCIPFLWRDGDSAWTQMIYEGEPVYDYLLYKNSFYLVDWEQTVVLDSTTLNVTCEIEHPHIKSNEEDDFDVDVENFLVESSSGELLMVAWDLFYRMWIFQLDSSGEQPKWVRVRSIGEDILFLYNYGAMCFNTDGIRGSDTNCVYFIPAGGDNYREATIFNIEDDTIFNILDATGEFLSEIGVRRAVWIIPRCS